MNLTGVDTISNKTLKIISSIKVGAYEIPGHPEHPLRVLRSLQYLKTILPPEHFQEPPSASLKKIRAVHEEDMVQRVEKEEYFDPDTPGASGIWESSLLSAGAALQAASESLKGVKAFSLMRPPGHHATPGHSMGFCYFNSMAVAIQDMYQSKMADRIAVLDLDCHHGNGTEDFCFGKDEFLYVSLHQFPAYPGSGRQSKGNCLNYPLSPGTTDMHYFPAMESAMNKVLEFKADLLGISMGFDTYEKDPLTEFGLGRKDYKKIGKALREFKIPTFALLEGGYHDDLPYLIEDFLEGWTS